MLENISNSDIISATTIKLYQRWVKNIEPGDKTLKPCDLNNILICDSDRALTSITWTNSIGSINHVHIMTVIKDESSSRIGDDMSELTNPSGIIKIFM